MTIENLEKKLNEEKLDNMYLLYGPELFLLESALKKIKKYFGELIIGINYITLDENTIDTLIPNIETPAFGYEKKLIIVKNSTLFKKEGRKKTVKLSELKEKIETYFIENMDMIKESIVLVFIEDEIEKAKLYEIIEKEGVVCEFEFQKPVQITKRIKSICNAYKVNISDETIRYFIEFCGTNMQNLINEIRKLIEYAGINGEIKKEDIDKLSTKQLESIIFDLTDNLGKKKIVKSLEILNNLIYAKEPLQKILITVYKHFKKLYMIKLSEEYGKDVKETLKLKPNQTFLVNKYREQARLFTKEGLRILLYELVLLDVNYKSGLIDLKIGFESILCMYCS